MTSGATAQSHGQRVASALRRDILSGAFSPGQRFTEEVLSEHYQVSRVPVREALRVLEAEGFVTITPYKGASVSVVTPQDAADLFAVREVVEELAVRRAARTRTEADVAHLREVVRSGFEAQAAGLVQEHARLNTVLHMYLAEISGNASLHSLLRQLSAKIEWLYTADVQHRDMSWEELQEIVEAIADGDAERAGGLMRAHVATSRASYLETVGPVDGL